MPRATFIQRFAAYLIDAIIVAIVVGILEALVQAASKALAPSSVADSTAWAVAMLAPMFIARLLDLGLTLAYYGYFWATTGQTPGKRVMRIKVVKADGSQITWNDALARSAGYLLSGLAGGLGFLWAAWDPGGQAWHDKLAHTRVVKAAQ